MPELSEGGVAETLMDLDEELLSEAARALGTASNTDTVNEALRHVVERSRKGDSRASPN